MAELLHDNLHLNSNSLQENENIRNILVRLEPSLAGSSCVPAIAGSQKRVYFIGNNHILRIPFNESVRRELEIEQQLLKRLEGRLCLPVPKLIAVDSETGADLCLKAPGEVISWQVWGELGPSGRSKVGRYFGHFLADLHSEVSIDEALTLGVPEYIPPVPEYFKDNLASIMTGCRLEYLLSSVLAVLPRLCEQTLKPVLLHNDFSHHNIVFELPSMKAVGVFDFGDAHIGDLHRDLRFDPGLECDENIVVDEYEESGGQRISRARQRAWHAVSALECLIHSLKNEGADLQAARWGWVGYVSDWDLSFFDQGVIIDMKKIKHQNQ